MGQGSDRAKEGGGCWGVLCGPGCKQVLGLFSLTHKPLLPQEVGRSHSRTVAWGTWEGSGWSLSGSSICGALHAEPTPGRVSSAFRNALCQGLAVSLPPTRQPLSGPDGGAPLSDADHVPAIGDVLQGLGTQRPLVSSDSQEEAFCPAGPPAIPLSLHHPKRGLWRLLRGC